METIVGEAKFKFSRCENVTWFKALDGKEVGISFVSAETLTFERSIKLHDGRCSIYCDFLWSISSERNREIRSMHLTAFVISSRGKSMEFGFIDRLLMSPTFQA